MARLSDIFLPDFDRGRRAVIKDLAAIGTKTLRVRLSIGPPKRLSSRWPVLQQNGCCQTANAAA